MIAGGGWRRRVPIARRIQRRESRDRSSGFGPDHVRGQPAFVPASKSRRPASLPVRQGLGLRPGLLIDRSSPHAGPLTAIDPGTSLLRRLYRRSRFARLLAFPTSRRGIGRSTDWRPLSGRASAGQSRSRPAKTIPFDPTMAGWPVPRLDGDFESFVRFGPCLDEEATQMADPPRPTSSAFPSTRVRSSIGGPGRKPGLAAGLLRTWRRASSG